MMRILSVLLVLLPLCAQAADPRVISGDHADFARLYISFEERPGWALARSDGEVVLQVDRPGTVFDVSRVFDKIDRSRLQSIEGSEAGLRLILACKCDVVATEDARAGLILDIRDPRPGTFSQPPDILHLATSIRPPETAEKNLPQPVPTVSAPTRSVPPALVDPLFDEIQKALDRASQQGSAIDLLSEGLARAATQNLVQVTRPNTRARPPSSDAPADIRLARNIEISTSTERALSTQTTRSSSRVDGSSCWPDSAVSVQEWADHEAPFAALARARREAVSENGTLSPDGLLSVAKVYIFLGFGAEAQLILRASGDASVPLLLTLAEIVDGTTPMAPSLRGQGGCPGHAAMWSILNAPAGEETLPEDLTDILRTFKELPRHLKLSLGPELAQRLSLARDPDAARMVLSDIEAHTNTQSPELRLVGLSLRSSTDDAAFAQLATKTDLTGARAAAAMLESQLDAGTQPTWPDIERVEALARATLGDPVSVSLAALALEARLSNGDFVGVLNRLLDPQLSVALDPAARTIAKQQLWASAVFDASDEVILRIIAAFGVPEDMSVHPPEVQAHSAQSLMDLHLLEDAENIISAIADPAQQALLFAELKLAINQPEEAVPLIVAGGAAGSTLWARALAATGRHQDVATYFASKDEPDAALVPALRGQAWGLFDENAQQRFAPLASLSAQAPTPASNTQRLAQSRDSRGRISDVLDDLQTLSQ